MHKDSIYFLANIDFLKCLNKVVIRNISRKNRIVDKFYLPITHINRETRRMLLEYKINITTPAYHHMCLSKHRKIYTACFISMGVINHYSFAFNV